MQCVDTDGMLPAVHIHKEVIDLARELQPALAAIRSYGSEGSITLRMQSGFISSIEFIVRKFRKKPVI